MSTLEPVHQSLEVSAQILGVLKQRAKEDRELELHIEAATWKVTAAMHKFSSDEWQKRAENLDDEYQALEEQLEQLQYSPDVENPKENPDA